MSRTKTVIINTIWELGYYFIVIALGFLAPRFIILVYGSEVNGLSSTITQILNIILILQAGATTAAIFSLYKPIADEDYTEIGRKIYSAEGFFKKISFVFLAIMLVVAAFTSFYIKSDLDSKYIFIAFVIMGLKSFLDLFFTSKFRIIFTAFQEKFVISIATLIEQVVYYALVFLTLFFHAHFVLIYLWLFAGCVVKVIYLEIRFKKEFKNLIPEYRGEAYGKINGRGYALANEVAHSVVSSSIAIILSFMYGLQETSVYSVYALVLQAIYLVATALYQSFAPSFGNLIAAENQGDSKRVFGIFQYMFTMFNTVMYLCMIMLIVPFVNIYTSGATDINYSNLMLASLLGLQGIISAYRIPYNVLVSTCGFFKETWKQPVICSFVSIIISLFLGRIEYAFILWGPIVFYLINFVYQHFKIRTIAPHIISSNTFRMFSISIVGFMGAVAVCYFVEISQSIVAWILSALVCLIVTTGYVLVLSRVLLFEELNEATNYIRKHVRKKKSV